MSAKQCDKKGVIVLGDAFNMRHPIIASGMMVALSDVLILRNLLRPVPSFSNTKKVLELVKSFYIIRKVSSDILFFFYNDELYSIGCSLKCVKGHGSIIKYAGLAD